MFEFKNIDRFIPGRFERMGMLKGKRWYTGFEPKDEEPGNEAYLVLFKPKRKEYGDRKIFCANHYGEFIGYLLAIGSRTPACKVELASLSKYYENIYKERNCATPEQKNGCISYCNLENGEVLHHGQLVIDEYARNHPSIESVKHYENDINVYSDTFMYNDEPVATQSWKVTNVDFDLGWSDSYGAVSEVTGSGTSRRTKAVSPQLIPLYEGGKIEVNASGELKAVEGGSKFNSIQVNNFHSLNNNQLLLILLISVIFNVFNSLLPSLLLTISLPLVVNI